MNFKKCGSKLSVVFLVVILIASTMSFSFGEDDVLKRPTIKGESGIVYCENNGDVLYSKNMDKRIEPYSITKILTAFLAVTNLNLEQTITIDKEIADVGEATMYLEVGEKIKVKDLLYGTLLRSANDAAYALGIAVSGDMESFVKKMNQTVENLGLENTHFTNPHGLKAKKHYTSAYDMMVIASEVFENETIQKITSTYEYKIPKTNKSKERVIYNKTHKFKYEGVSNCKTGTWDADNSTMVCRFNKDGLTLYSVLMGEPFNDRFTDMTKILDYSRSKIGSVIVEPKGKSMGTTTVKHGAVRTVEGYLKEQAECYIPKEASKSLLSEKIVYDEVKAPVKKDQIIGRLDIYLADDIVNQVAIRAKNEVKKGWFTSYIGISNRVAIIIFRVIAVVLILFISLLIVRANNLKKRKARRLAKIKQLAKEQEEREREKRERDWYF